MSQKVNRAKNYTLPEKRYLLKLVLKYKAIIENRKTDKLSCERKQLVWKRIEDEFNASSPSFIFRTGDCLKQAYENKKKEARKQYASEMLNGESENTPKDECYKILLSIINDPATASNLAINGLVNKYDSDSVLFHSTPSTSNDEQVHKQGFDVFTEDEDTTIDMNEVFNNREVLQIKTDNLSNSRKYTPVQLKRPVSDTLTFNKLSVRERILMEQKSKISEEIETKRPNLQQNIGGQPGTTTIKVQSSSAIAQKYELFMDKRLLIAKLQAEEAKRNLERGEEEHELKKTKINLEIEKLKQEIQLNKIKSKLMFS